ncbi:MAG TPA: hypothetical protein EYG85_08805 [Crocinitomix sp.]|nr:hypothetical protein [Crocinitomix sp.]
MKKFLPTKKFYKSKLNLTFTVLIAMGTLIINDPQIVEAMPKEYIGYITSVVGVLGIVLRTFFTETVLEA